MIRRGMGEHASSILVATLSSAFGVALLQVTGVLGVAIGADDRTGSSPAAIMMLAIVSVVFMVIAIYVASIVTANTFATVVAGRTRTIALLRLIGSSARAQRRAVAREGLGVGILGALLGAIAGTLFVAMLTLVCVQTGFLPSLDYGHFQPTVLLPVAGVVLTTWLASWVGSKRVLTVTPMQAIGSAAERSRDEVAARPKRNTTAAVLIAVGAALLVLGVVAGLVTPLAVFLGLIGGILSFTGVVLAAEFVMPPALRLAGKLLGASAEARLAAENALRYPERSSRTTIGLVIGVTLITMFGVAVASFRQMVRIAQQAQPYVYQGIDDILNITVTVFSVLVGFSALIAAVGMMNNLSLSVMQRTRELGLLRALGFSTRQLRRMIRAESAQLTLASVLAGLVLGAFYGWVGAQSLLGAANGMPGIVPPGVPWLLLAVIALATALLTWVASVAPARRAIRVSPVEALAVD